ncbi:DUF6298 domain-containing protein [Gaoshiqia sediminis]|uniref:DUF6298 domain-containing protein n=1 Tax=Gaoshiqia sediminis TaxID=2986998 RepID=A0AA41Y1L5_9BACT|nr:DUF6298 domain-containing protein [Gaoshiqia sediminis]MCW0481799.1 DUF6298 domain-containing protein [Gaoshiqia sediminis]
MNHSFKNKNISKTFAWRYHAKVLSFFLLLQGFASTNQAQQSVVKPLKIAGGEVTSVPDSLGNRIPDFSYAGYQAGEKAIPDVRVKVVVPMREGDATAAIQSAINYVAGLPIDADGFRGAILLDRGTHSVFGSLTIPASGIVLRGYGQGENGTVLLGAGTDRETLVQVLGADNRREEKPLEITDAYVPVGAFSFSVEDGHTLKAGDQVTVWRPATNNWIEMLGMKEFGGETGWLGWREGDQDIRWDRTVVSVEGTRVTIDAPITTALDQQMGGGKLVRYELPGRISQVGIENLTLRSAYDPENPKDENHRWMAITLENVCDAWVRQVTFEHFAGSAVAVYESARRVTVEDCQSLNPVSEIGGQRRYTFFVTGTQTLVQRCYAQFGYHDFAVGACAAGPIAFVQCESHLPHQYSGTIDNWASGVLLDIVNVDGHALGFPNRGPEGRGAGWTGANSMMWQCSAARMDNPAPPGAMNWAYGAWSLFNGNGFWESPNSHVNPRSLYYAQLQSRLKADLTDRASLLIVETNATSSPTIEQAAELTVLSRQPAITLQEWIARAPEVNPVSTDFAGIRTIDEIGVQQEKEKAFGFPMGLKNGWLVRGDHVLTGMRQSVPWWSGNIRPKGLAGAKPAITRYVPGRTGTGYTDDLNQLTDTMLKNNQIGMEQNYALWYERRRDDHERVRRMDGDVWPPFYELPFARIGQGLAWDGLSKYDLTRYNPWYWMRLKQFANLADQKGLVLVHQNYFQHNILEAGAHWADSPWRPVNNINNTGFPEPPPYAGDKRIFMDEHFYDVTHPVRRELHRAYIRQCLENFRGNTGVIQLTSEEYTGPLHFVEFWLDVIGEWEAETGEQVITGLSATKDVQDAILADPVRSGIVDVIDIRYWAYRADSSLYAPQGGQHLAPRQHARQVKTGKRSFEQVYRAVSEYRLAHPEKAVMYSEGQYTAFGWAVFMAGGSLAPIPQVEDEDFLGSASAMHPVENNEPGVYTLQNKSGEMIIYLESGKTLEPDLKPAKGNFKLFRTDPANGKLIGKPEKLKNGKPVRLENPTNKPVVIRLGR